MLQQLIDYAVYLVVRVAIAFVQALPIGVCERIAGGMATLFTTVLPVRRKVLRENLKIALPTLTEAEQQRLAWGMWRHLFLMIMEIAHTPRRVHRTNWRELVDVPQNEAIIRTMCTTRPSVVISGHYGNFELGGYLLGMFGFPTHTVARTLDNRHIDRFVNDFRGRTGQYILPKQGSSEQIEQLLSSGGALTLLGDQAGGNRGCWVPFFGRPASTHKAVALFSLSFEAPTIVVGVRRKQRMLQYEIEVADVVDPADRDFAHAGVQPMTEWYTGCLERIILSDPEQYWWIHRRWKGEIPEKIRRRLERRGKLAA
ncbi:lysophospholipid acyltransferase family protein [Aeoliella mucimassa]|uniref:Lipid A biosynthesis lauroyl acyltransferase n=1 Tax=Aeoliella mucimassa TaxID=2527972 RepID=A0A518ALH8_9BACT|nr:lysophospholipid acyltransferase family protein [Aeoliella mucimassa]QDU55583.1 Lipid A biosynthesis lauroyl acyltransferase [Aeoliella mucimassa]